VEINRCRYNGSALDEYREKTSPYLGEAKGRWPFHVDPDDISHVFFRDPRTRKWHSLAWEHAPMLDAPFSREALTFARRLAASKYTYPNDRLALTDLLKRWNMGLDMNRTERRMALRISREQAAVELPDLDDDQPLEQLASVRKVLEASAGPADRPPAEPEGAEAGDDDDPDELDLVASPPTADGDDRVEEQDGLVPDDFGDDFYATALKDVDE
jgi:hypothetical protein